MSARKLTGCLMMAVGLLAAAACAGPGYGEKLFVQTRHADDIDFAAYATYAWAPEDDARAALVFRNNPELPELISSAVDRELAIKGFEKVPPHAADFLMSMSASVQDVTVLSRQRYQSWSHGYNRSSFGTVNTATRMAKMAEGTLMLEIIDVASEGVVWQSDAAGVITRRDDMVRAVNAAVIRMLEDFPPKS